MPERSVVRWGELFDRVNSNLDGQVDGIESLLEVVLLNRGRDV